jgi:hypothetical protein
MIRCSTGTGLLEPADCAAPLTSAIKAASPRPRRMEEGWTVNGLNMGYLQTQGSVRFSQGLGLGGSTG